MIDNNKNNPQTEQRIEIARAHVQDILSLSIGYSADKKTMVVADTQSPLALILTEAYKRCLHHAEYIDFYSVSPEEVIAKLKALSPSDLVVLIQTSSFRLNAFRLRVELFEQSLKVIEHPHLGRMLGDEVDIYIESLAYDAAYMGQTGRALKHLLDNAKNGMVESGGEQLIFASPFESAKLNIGDYSGMKNTGGQFPIGEVFTESKILEAVSGRVNIFAFGDRTFSVNKVDTPITLVIKEGKVTDTVNSTSEFDQVLENIRADESVVWVRELGFGMNRAFTKNKLVTDIGTYERMCGVHLSLGAKHSLYKKPQLRTADTRHHVDVFVDTNYVSLDDKVIYKEGAWQV